ncbi:hypothetical protein AB0903_27050 [Streptomyces sp. NPDC048389]|uniref:hypothetical protein n=1 Tax=Streptomyces sp. NPDC048389 TaxID=3154622 RepID=UPI003456DF56
MPNRNRPGRARTLVRLAVLVLACLVRALLPVPASASDAGRRPPGYRVFGDDAEMPMLPPHLFRRARREDDVLHRSAYRVRPYLVAHEQRSRRRALALALDGIDIGPWVIHGHPIGQPAPATALTGVAA